MRLSTRERSHSVLPPLGAGIKSCGGAFLPGKKTLFFEIPLLLTCTASASPLPLWASSILDTCLRDKRA